MKKYIEILEKFNYVTILEKYKNLLINAEKTEGTVGFFGESTNIIKVVSDLLNIPKWSELLFPSDICLTVSYGKEKYIITENEKDIEVSLEDFISKVQSKNIDSNLSVKGKIYLPLEYLKNITMILSSNSELDDIIFVDIDVVCICFSAVKILSAREKKLLINPLIKEKILFLTDIDKLNSDEDKKMVLNIFNKIKVDESYVLGSDDFCGSDLIKDWKNKIKIIKPLRKIKIDEYIKPKIIEALNKSKEEIQEEVNKKINLIKHLETTKNKFSDYNQQTSLYISVNYINPMIDSVMNELMKFKTEMDKNIEIGVEEENDLKALEDNIPYYLTGEWDDFFNNLLFLKVQKILEDFAVNAEKYVNEKINDYLNLNLNEDEIKYVYELISHDFSSDEEMKNYNLVNTVLETEENLGFKSLFPKILVGAGGIMLLLGGGFVYPVLAIGAGIFGNAKVKNEIKIKLIKSGKEYNNKCLYETKDNLENAVAELNESVKTAVNNSFSGIIDKILSLINNVSDQTEDIKNQINLIDNTIKKLSEGE